MGVDRTTSGALTATIVLLQWNPFIQGNPSLATHLSINKEMILAKSREEHVPSLSAALHPSAGPEAPSQA